MTRRGRPRLSDEEKKNRGTFKPSRSSGNEVAEILLVDAGSPLLDLSAEASEFFASVTQTMIQYKTMATVDVWTVSMMCREYDIYLGTLGKSDIEIDANGVSKVSAYFTIRNKALQNIMKMAFDLGITPMLRQKLRGMKETEKKPKDAAAKFFK
jgi:phage terminase small subunit